MLSKFRDFLKEWLTDETQLLALEQDTALNITAITRQVRSLELKIRRNTENQLSGEYKSRFRGQGMQFSDVRVYQYGDDVRHIDWRTSARSQQTYVKTYEEERQQQVILCLDVSASASFGSGLISKRDACVQALASVAFSAVENRDLISLLLFSDRIEGYVQPGKGRRHVLRVLEQALARKASSRATNLEIPLRNIAATAKHRSIIIIASDFQASLPIKLLKRVGAKHDLICVVVDDPRELAIPNIGLVAVQDPESQRTALLDTSSASARKKFNEQVHKERSYLLEQLKSTGASVLSLSTTDDTARKFIEFFRYRSKR